TAFCDVEFAAHEPTGPLRTVAEVQDPFKRLRKPDAQLLGRQFPERCRVAYRPSVRGGIGVNAELTHQAAKVSPRQFTRLRPPKRNGGWKRGSFTGKRCAGRSIGHGSGVASDVSFVSDTFSVRDTFSIRADCLGAVLSYEPMDPPRDEAGRSATDHLSQAVRPLMDQLLMNHTMPAPFQ